MGSKKKSKTTSQQTTTAAPPSWTMPGISDAAGRVTDALQNLPGDKYTGDFYAQPNMDLVNGAVQNYTNAAVNANALSDWLTTQMKMDPSAAIAQATQPVFQQLTQQVLPGLKSSSIDSGAYSGDRAMQVLPEQAISDATKNAEGIASAYQQQMLAQLPALTDEIMKLQTGSGDILSGANSLYTSAQQAAIDNAKAKNQYSWQYPFQGLDIASSLLAQLSGGYGTTTSNGTSTNVQSSSGLGNVVGGILGGLSTIGSLPLGGGQTLLGSLFSK